VTVRAVLFDYGHTLVDFTVPEDALHEAYGEIRRRLVREANAELPDVPQLIEAVAKGVVRAVDESYASDRLIELDILQLFGEMLGRLGLAPSPETVRWVVEAEHDALARHLVCPDEIIEAIATIRGAGLKIGIISNAHLLPYMMRRNWRTLGFGQYVDASLISSEAGIRKPHPDVFRRVLKMLDVAPEQAIFVGDRLIDDVGGAHAVGMRAVLTRQFRQEKLEDGGEEPDLVVDRLPEILPFVLEEAGPA